MSRLSVRTMCAWTQGVTIRFEVVSRGDVEQGSGTHMLRLGYTCCVHRPPPLSQLPPLSVIYRTAENVPPVEVWIVIFHTDERLTG